MKTNITVQTYEVLNSMTRDEVRALATHLNVPRGKDKKNTVANLSRAIADGKARIKSLVTISANPPAGVSYTPPLFVKKFRSYKPDRVLSTVPPVTSAAK